MLKKLILFTIIFGSTQVYSMDSDTKEKNNLCCVYYCYVCKSNINQTDTLPASNSLELHFKNEHLICMVCDKQFETESQINKHFSTDHYNKIKTW